MQLGLIGLGRIGSEVALRADSFDMRVLGYDPYISEAAAREVQVELVPLERLLAESDFVSLHTALSPATQNLIHAGTLAQMKTGARIINAARGELIDEAALADALKSGKLAGAALDVFVHEPPKDSPLMGMANVIATPHVAGSTTEAQEEVGTPRRRHRPRFRTALRGESGPQAAGQQAAGAGQGSQRALSRHG